MKKFALREILKERCINQSQFCRKIGLDRAHFWRIVKTGRTTVKTLEKIAEALGLSVPDLWREVPEVTEEEGK